MSTSPAHTTTNSISADKAHEKTPAQVVETMYKLFSKITAHLPRAQRHAEHGPNTLYRLQTEFSYLTHEVIMCSPAIAQSYIYKCNRFINQVMKDYPKTKPGQ